MSWRKHAENRRIHFLCYRCYLHIEEKCNVSRADYHDKMEVFPVIMNHSNSVNVITFYILHFIFFILCFHKHYVTHLHYNIFSVSISILMMYRSVCFFGFDLLIQFCLIVLCS